MTGSSGFVGRRLCACLLQQGWSVRGLSRRGLAPEGVEAVACDLLQRPVDEALLRGVDVVVHTAARVHVMHDQADDPLCEFRKMNVEATLRLAQQAADCGVKRFVFISSIKVNGECSDDRVPFSPDDTDIPDDPYGRSKWEAEQGLHTLAAETELEVVIVRPPLVYGPGVKGNFLRLLKWVERGVPLPLGAVENRRSLVALDNLVDFIALCAEHPDAAGETFLIADGQDISTTQLLQQLAHAMGRQARLLAVPVGWMRCAAGLMGKSDMADRLFGSLQVDSSKARELLGWRPVITMQAQLHSTVEAYRREATV